MEDEVEYEEVEEEVEEDKEEEVVEEEEDAEEVEEETTANGAGSATGGDDSMNVDEEDDRDEDEIKQHNELLTLPPHGSEVYFGGLPHDATEEDLKSFCESAGEATEVCFVLLLDARLFLRFMLVVFISGFNDEWPG